MLDGAADLRPSLSPSDSLSAINEGAGWTSGAIMITDSSGFPKILDLTGLNPCPALGQLVESSFPSDEGDAANQIDPP